MFAKVMKPFEYSADGINSRTVHIGEVLNFSDDCAPGLAAAGLIAEPVLAECKMEPLIAETPYTKLPDVPAQPEFDQVELEPLQGALSIRDAGKGWFAVFRGEEKLTKSFRSKSEAESAMAAMMNPNS
jgi:hypothetical protein